VTIAAAPKRKEEREGGGKGGEFAAAISIFAPVPDERFHSEKRRGRGKKEGRLIEVPLRARGSTTRGAEGVAAVLHGGKRRGEGRGKIILSQRIARSPISPPYLCWIALVALVLPTRPRKGRREGKGKKEKKKRDIAPLRRLPVDEGFICGVRRAGKREGEKNKGQPVVRGRREYSS